MFNVIMVNSFISIVWARNMESFKESQETS